MLHRMTRPDAAATIVVAGATGRQGGAVARRLLDAGWSVRALTRSPQSKAARALATAGAEVVRADMSDRASLDAALAGAYGVFSVQNPAISGVEDEVRQGKNVADAARDAELQHVVYASAGTGAADTGVEWWNSKLAIEAHMRGLGLPLTIVRPVAFMELMTDRDFYPPVSTWHLMPKLAGATTPIPWIAVDDAAAVAVLAFADRDRYVGRDLKLAAELRSIDECRALYEEVRGRRPRGFPMPVWMFNRVGSRDLVRMWRWLRASPPAGDPATLRAIRPEALTVRDWLKHRAPSPARRG